MDKYEIGDTYYYKRTILDKTNNSKVKIRSVLRDVVVACDDKCNTYVISKHDNLLFRTKQEAKK
jgi:hypothetical protein